jgi:hypothetical protein
MKREADGSEQDRTTHGAPSTVPSKPTFAEPYYVIVFKASAGSAPYRPVVDGRAYTSAVATLPYGLDRELATALPAMWYCLHLPRTNLDLTDMHAKGMKASQLLVDLPHHIMLLPVPWPEPLPILFPAHWPAIILAPKTLRSEAAQLASLLPVVCDIADTADLNVASLQRHWTALYAALRLDHPRYAWPSRIFSDSPQRALLLPNLFLARQFRGGRDEEIPDVGPTKAAVMGYSANCQVVLSATARLEAENIALSQAAARFPQTIAEEWRSYKCPVALLLPGISRTAASRKVARLRAKHGIDVSTDDARVENTALEFLAAHRAAARLGVSVNAASVPDQAFTTLYTLERMFDGPRVSPRKVTKHLDRLSHEVVPGLVAEERFALLHASSITSFSEFPIGLVTIPPDTSPLCCRTPIAYRPLCPLTRALQFETFSVPIIYLRDRLAILCLECIPREDPVGRLSRDGWKQAFEELRGRRDVVFDFVEVDSIAGLREALNAREYHIVVISAHGYYDRGTNRTGFRVGLRDIVFEHELGSLPPLVCLAACQVAPRGSGSLNVTDLLFRQGAVAVLGTLVPIDVRRNAHLMVRFFVYVAETLDGRNSFRSIDEVWQFTATSNAVLDVALGARRATDWMWEKWNGTYGIKDFMLTQSVGRVRKGHVYSDTEMIMQAMATERGKGVAFKAWLTNQGYVPESIFYMFLGWPERLILCDRQFEEARDFYGEAWSPDASGQGVCSQRYSAPCQSGSSHPLRGSC